MIITDLFLASPNPERVIRAENASHYYETLTSIKEIFKHELRLVIGTVLNCYLCWDFLVFATDPKGPGAGVLIRNQIEKDPHWYQKYIHNEIQTRGRWVIIGGMLFRRFRSLKNKSCKDALKSLPIAIVGFMLDLPVMILANHKIKKGSAVGFW